MMSNDIARKRPISKHTTVLTALGTLIALAIGGAVAAFPAAAATVCPACYGFERLAAELFVERSMPLEQRAHTVVIIDKARERVAGFYGDLGRPPRVLVCATAACYRRVGGGGSRGMALLHLALFLSPRGIDPVIAAHELSHIELHHRLGLVKAYRNAIPQWFDEGVAVLVSNDPRYLAPAGAADRCLVAPDDDLPVTLAAWLPRASKDSLYAKAACRVSRWVASKGGAGAVTDLIRRVAQGEDFARIFP